MPFKRDHDRRLLRFAQEMRRDPTDAEKKLWHLLRRKQLAGLNFRRQVPVAGYILDFYCLKAGPQSRQTAASTWTNHRSDTTRGARKSSSRVAYESCASLTTPS